MVAITLQQLRVFVAVADHRSFTRGAQAVYMTQSAASQHVRALEHALGTLLLERSGGELRPTKAGEGLLQYARDILRTAEETERYVAAVRDGGAGRLALAAAGSAVYLVPPLVAAFRATHPQVEVTLQVLAAGALLDAVAAGEADAGLVAGPTLGSRLEASPLCLDRIVAVAGPGSPLLAAAALAPLSLEQVLAQPVIGPTTATGSWRLIEREAAYRGLLLRAKLRLEGIDAIKKAVEAGLGIAFLSAWAVERELAMGTLRLLPLELPPLIRRFELVRRAGAHVDGVLASFAAFAPAHLARRLPPLVAECAASQEHVA